MGRSQRRGPAVKQERREEAVVRVAAWRALSPAEQLASLSGRRGESRKQVGRLLAHGA